MESQRAEIENTSTRKRLNELERAASEFLRDHAAEDEAAPESERKEVSLRLKQKGYSLQPPYAQMVKGESIYFTFSVLQELFPEFDPGSAVSIECLSTAIVAETTVCGLEAHPTREGLLRVRFKVTGVDATAATGVRIRLGQILEESAIEVLATRADRYANVTTFGFERSRYSGSCGTKRKRLRLLAPLSKCMTPTVVSLASESVKLAVPSTVVMAPDPVLRVAIADFSVRLPETELATTVRASALGDQANTQVRAMPDAGAALKIGIKDIDLGNQRYRLKNNVLEIAARHKSLHRYLGSAAEGFPGQNERHFRVLVAEIVADAVCANVVSRNAETNPESYANADWDQYYAEYSEYMTKFLPITHKINVPD